MTEPYVVVVPRSLGDANFIDILRAAGCIVQEPEMDTATREALAFQSEVAKRHLPEPDEEAPVADDIKELWEHWLTLFWDGKGRKPTLLPERRRLLRARRRRWSVEELKAVMDFVSKSPFHMGQNDANKRYTDLKHIMSNDVKVEQKLSLIDEGKSSQSADKVTDIRLNLQKLAAKMRSGTATLADRQELGKLAKQLPQGEMFDWRTGDFQSGE